MRRAAAIVTSLMIGLAAQAEDGTTDAEGGDQEQTRSLDSYQSSETRSLDSDDSGDSGDTGASQEPDSARTRSAEDLEAVDTGSMVDLDGAEADAPQPLAAPAPLPEVGSAEQRAEAKRLYDEAVATARRLESANAAYSQMMARGHPAGDARARIISEREEALKAHQQANARYGAMLERLGR